MSNNTILCQKCKKVKTEHETGLCSHCRRKEFAVSLPNWGEESEPQKIDIRTIEATIAAYSKTLDILKQRRDGKSFQEIGLEFELSSIAAYSAFNFAICNHYRFEVVE